MPEIQAFRAIRYNLGRVGSLGDVVAPPYDVIGPDLQEQLYRKHPNNVVRLILNRIEPGDDDEVNNRYTRAKRLLSSWLSEGVLQTEPDPAIYVYQQEFTWEGASHVRRGFMARMRLSPFGQGQVFPHEETMPGPKADRLMLMTLCKANLSQVFGLYPDPAHECQAILDEAVSRLTPVVATDHLGVVNRMWAVTDVQTISALAGAVGPRPVFIADGHHRYETACAYREHVHQTGALGPEHPANYVLMMFVATEDPGLVVLPTHRLFRGLPPMTSEELAARLAPYFATRGAGQGAGQAPAVWEDIVTGSDQGALGLFTQKDQRWLLADLSDEGRARMAEVAREHNEEWRSLGVSLLHRLVIETLLDGVELPKPKYVHQVPEVVEGLAAGEFPLAALVMPASIEHVRTISLCGERLPAKSTYFYPKLLSGLVINPLE
ncbi:MAG: DUF1015 domain-containing protein [Thermoguttaceae bacterium]|jgi:uncharacterized protein (DUF1015 family)